MALFGVIPIWIIVVLALLLIVIFLVRWSNNINVLQFAKQNFFYFFLAAVFVFFAISVVHIHTAYDVDLNTKEGFFSMMKIYYSWMVNVGKNVGRVTGYAIQQDWFVNNSSNVTK